MKRVETLTDWAAPRSRTRRRGPAVPRRIVHTVPDVPRPSLLGLIPFGSLVVAGFILLLLAWILMVPVVRPDPETAVEAPDLPTAEEIDGATPIWRVGPALTR